MGCEDGLGHHRRLNQEYKDGIQSRNGYDKNTAKVLFKGVYSIIRSSGFYFRLDDSSVSLLKIVPLDQAEGTYTTETLATIPVAKTDVEIAYDNDIMISNITLTIDRTMDAKPYLSKPSAFDTEGLVRFELRFDDADGLITVKSGDVIRHFIQKDIKLTSLYNRGKLV